MKLTIWDPKTGAPEALAVMVFENDTVYDDESLSAFIGKASELGGFEGKKGAELLVFPEAGSGVNVKKLLLIGCGKKDKADLETFRTFSGAAVQSLIKKKVMAASLLAPSKSKITMDPEKTLTAIMEGALLANHVYTDYLTDNNSKTLESIEVFAEAQLVEAYAALPARIDIITQGTMMAMDWVSMPSNDKYPELLANIYKSTAEEFSDKIKVTVFDEAYLEKNGFGALMAVGQGSEHKPRFVVMDYTPLKDSGEKPFVLIGKGVTFDSGGINLKSSEGINGMKMDMGGSAAAAATLISLARLGFPRRVVAVTPMAENMPSGIATRTGDVIKTLNGKFVEITNTDAEGRLILADAITYTVRELKPEFIIDLATLTGACVVALGESMAGLFSTDDDLSDAIAKAGEITYERCWKLPLPEDYNEELKSDVADMRNTGKSRMGGAITAALFLKTFIEDVKWAHIDIAGPAMAKKAGAYMKPGGTGFGVRLLCEALYQLL